MKKYMTQGYRRFIIPLALAAITFALVLVLALPYQLEVAKNGSISISLKTARAQSGSYFGLGTGNNTYEESAGTLNGMRFLADLSPLLEQETNLTHAAADAPAAVANGKLYVFGGYGTSDTNCLNDTQEYDPVTNSWAQKAAMPTARWGAAAAELGGKIYVFGGTAGGKNASNKCESFDVAGNSWVTKTNLPTAYPNGIMAVTVGPYIYLFYGNDTLQFDPGGNGGAGSYTLKASSPVWTRWGTCAYVNVGGEDRVYIIGGSNSSLVFQNTNYYYRPGTDTWSSAQAAVPYAAHGVISGNPVSNGKVYYGFGWSGNEAFYNSLYSYDPSSNSWSAPLSHGIVARDGVSCGVIGDRLYIAGGRNSGASPCGLDNNESYLLGTTPVTLGSLNELDILFDDATPNGKVRLGVYTDNNGAPGSLLLDAGAVAVADGWVGAGRLSLKVYNGTYYWLVFNLKNANGVRYQSGQAAGSHYWVSSAYGALPAQFNLTGAGYNNNQYVLRASVNIMENNAPVAVDDAYSTDEDTTLNIAAPGVLGNDIGDPLTAVLVSDVSHGTLTLNGNGSFTYTPNAGVIGSDSFTYKANDGQAHSNVATVSIAVNHAPVAVDDAYSVVKNGVLTEIAPGVLGNDMGDLLTAVLVSDVSHGTLTLNGNGSFTYTPNAGVIGSDSFTYKANDGVAESNVAMVSITITQPMTDTFGLDSGTNTYNESANILDVMRFQNTAGTGTLTKLEILFEGTSPVSKVRLAVYAENDGKPGSLLLDAGEVTVTNGWVSISGLSLPVTQDTNYWLAFNLKGANAVRYQSGQPEGSHYWARYAYGAFPGQYPAPAGSNSNEYVMRATVTVGGP
jgi:N-acetylneuraminic acid mutarotase